MSRKLLTATFASAWIGGGALADVPRVAVDIAPVHALVARVMEGVGAPDLVIQPGASPHEYSLRPSEARALQDADFVFWIGPALTPWMSGTIETLARDATVVELLEADGTIELELRESALFEAHDHDAHGDEDHETHEDHAEDEHHDHDAEHHDDEKDAHDSHDHETDHADHADDHEGHDPGAHDPHAWLSPRNAMNWLNVIASQLSAADPENASAYFSNAVAGRAEIEAVIAEVNATLDPVRGNAFIVFHDAYQYFETDFDLPAAGAISLTDASDPSPARIAEIQARIAEEGITCVLAEPQYNPSLVATVLDGTTAKTGILDPLGSDLQPGSGMYAQLIQNMSKALADCL